MTNEEKLDKILSDVGDIRERMARGDETFKNHESRLAKVEDAQSKVVWGILASVGAVATSVMLWAISHGAAK